MCSHACRILLSAIFKLQKQHLQWQESPCGLYVLIKIELKMKVRLEEALIALYIQYILIEVTVLQNVSSLFNVTTGNLDLQTQL